MRGTTHMAGGAVAGELMMVAANTQSVRDILIIGIGAVLGSLMPDIDSGQSRISNKTLGTKLVAYGTNTVFRHRGFIHTPCFCAILTLIMYFLIPLALKDIPGFDPGWVRMFALAFACGYISHLVLDSLNPTGIMWLSPFTKKKFHIARIKTMSLGDWGVCVALVAVAVVIAVTKIGPTKLHDAYNVYLNIGIHL